METVEEKQERYAPLVEELSRASEKEKLQILESNPYIQELFTRFPQLKVYLNLFDGIEKRLFLLLLLIGEGETLLEMMKEVSSPHEELQRLIRKLVDVENFYQPMGGLLGYCYQFLKLATEPPIASQCAYQQPPLLCLEEESKQVHRWVAEGIRELGRVAAIFPVGGAGDRLDLRDPESGEALPAARLRFQGKMLIEHLFRDLQALEYLYYKLFDQQLTIPVALMTSKEKNNYDHILLTCESNFWFQRHIQSIHICVQPLSPVLTEEGRFAFSAPLQLHLKPGGHGVIWKLAEEQGILSTLINEGRDKAIVRQINNPIAAFDYNLLALVGIGISEGRSFGFLSAERPVHISEGMIVLKEEEKEGGVDYSVTNIEYTDFVHQGIKDEPKEEGGTTSRFPTNTNILFVDLKKIQEAIEEDPFPGLLINLKEKFSRWVSPEKTELERASRLETTMQNVADNLVYPKVKKLSEDKKLQLPTFVGYLPRQKVISVTKRSFKSGKSAEQTPVQALYDLMHNHHTLFSKECGIELAPLPTFAEWLEKGPSYYFNYHPALGPLYSIIRQKIRGGKIVEGSELQLEVAEVSIENLDLEGSLVVRAEAPLGETGELGELTYSACSGKCELKEVRVENRGAILTQEAWTGEIKRHESLHIVLQGSGEFSATGVTFKGNYSIVVPHKTRVTVIQEGERVIFTEEKIEVPTWKWEYQLMPNCEIVLSKTN